MAGHVQGDQSLEDDCPSWPSGTQENQQTCGCATICHHIKYRAKSSGLVEVSRRVSIQGIQQTRNTVEEGAGTRMKRHVVERSDSEDDTRVPFQGQS